MKLKTQLQTAPNYEKTKDNWFYKKVDGQDIAVYVYKAGDHQGQIATTVVLNANQMKKFGLND